MNGPLLLASASPRRRELLGLLGVAFRVAAVDVDERRHPGEPPGAYALRVAHDKAREALRRDAGVPVLAADTTVALDGDVFGKPLGRDDALATLARLSARTHEVYTAVVLHDGNRVSEALTTSRVTFREIAPTEAAAYWDSGEPADKAGSYGMQALGSVFVRRIEGSHSGIIGLPLVETRELLEAAGLRCSMPLPEACARA